MSNIVQSSSSEPSGTGLPLPIAIILDEEDSCIGIEEGTTSYIADPDSSEVTIVQSNFNGKSWNSSDEPTKNHR